MIIDPSAVVARLSDPSPFVGRFVSGYLADLGRRAPIDADGVFAAIDAPRPIDSQTARMLYLNLAEVRPTPAGVARMVDELSTVAGNRLASGGWDPLPSALRRVEPSLLAPVIDRIETDAKLPWNYRRAMRERIDLCDRPAGELWDRLMADAETLERLWTHGRQQEVADATMRAESVIMAAIDSPGAPELVARSVELLAQPAVGHAREVLAMRLLSHRPPGPEAIGGLCARLDFDVDEYACEAATAALAAMGSDEVIRVVAGELQANSGDLLSRQVLLAMIKRPASLEALLAVTSGATAAWEDDPSVLESILQLVPTDESLLQKAGAMISNGFARKRLDWLESAWAYLGVSGLLGRNIDPAVRTLQPMLTALVKDDGEEPAAPDYSGLRRELFQADAAPDPVPVEIADALGYVVNPIRRSTDRVGRNDPCPCGSGKKYKKCCCM